MESNSERSSAVEHRVLRFLDWLYGIKFCKFYQRKLWKDLSALVASACFILVLMPKVAFKRRIIKRIFIVTYIYLVFFFFFFNNL